jgi:hypothetical protein
VIAARHGFYSRDEGGEVMKIIDDASNAVHMILYQKPKSRGDELVLDIEGHNFAVSANFTGEKLDNFFKLTDELKKAHSSQALSKLPCRV